MKKTKFKGLLRLAKYCMYYTNFSLRPFRIQADITDRCNFFCPTCSKWKTKPGNEMVTAEWRLVLDKLKGVSLLNRITFTGGEIFLRDDIFELIDYAKKQGFFITAITNGFLINKEKLARLERIGLDNLVMSLNGVREETHDSSRGIKGSYNRIMSLLPELGNYNIKINLETIIMQTNLDEIIPLAELAKENRLYGISYQVLANVKAHYALVNKQMDEVSEDWYKEEKFWIKDIDKIERVIRELIKRQEDGYPILNPTMQLKSMEDYYSKPESIKNMKCLSGVSTLYVDPYGKVRLCYGFEPAGNILEDDPITLWRSQKAKAIRKKMRNCKSMCRLLNNNF